MTYIYKLYDSSIIIKMSFKRNKREQYRKV